MKTIIQRAEDFAHVYDDKDRHFAEECYIQGATEQHQIDIEKAKMFAKKWYDEIVNLYLTELKDNEPFYTQGLEHIYKKLEKAMEKQP